MFPGVFGSDGFISCIIRVGRVPGEGRSWFIGHSLMLAVYSKGV